MEIKQVDPKKVAKWLELNKIAELKGYEIDWETNKYVPIRGVPRYQYWLEGDQDTPDLYKGDEDERKD